MNRPNFGDEISSNDRLHRIRASGGKKWLRHESLYTIAKPVSGIYIGYRMYSDGKVHYDIEYGNEYEATDFYEVWLVVPSVRNSPVAVLPRDVTLPVESKDNA